MTGGSLGPAQRSLVRVSAALASGSGQALELALEEAALAAASLEVEETLLQSYLFLGYPAALRGLAQWRRLHPASTAAASRDDRDEWSERGRALCRRVYSTRYRELRDNIRQLHPDMERWMVEEGYGKVLSRPGLEPVTREYCIVAVLAVADAGPQLYSHLRGAFNLGAPAGALAEALAVAEPFMDDARREAARATWRRVLARWRATHSGRPQTPAERALRTGGEAVAEPADEKRPQGAGA